MQGESLNTLLQGGTVGLFILFTIYITRIHNENQARWQSFYGEQFKLLNDTSRELTAMLTRYSDVLSTLTREIQANTEITRRLAEHLERGKHVQ